jgi:hypothetical protein
MSVLSVQFNTASSSTAPTVSQIEAICSLAQRIPANRAMILASFCGNIPNNALPADVRIASIKAIQTLSPLLSSYQVQQALNTLLPLIGNPHLPGGAVQEAIIALADLAPDAWIPLVLGKLNALYEEQPMISQPSTRDTLLQIIKQLAAQGYGASLKEITKKQIVFSLRIAWQKEIEDPSFRHSMRVDSFYDLFEILAEQGAADQLALFLTEEAIKGGDPKYEGTAMIPRLYILAQKALCHFQALDAVKALKANTHQYSAIWCLGRLQYAAPDADEMAQAMQTLLQTTARCWQQILYGFIVLGKVWPCLRQEKGSIIVFLNNALSKPGIISKNPFSYVTQGCAAWVLGEIAATAIGQHARAVAEALLTTGPIFYPDPDVRYCLLTAIGRMGERGRAESEIKSNLSKVFTRLVEYLDDQVLRIQQRASHILQHLTNKIPMDACAHYPSMVAKAVTVFRRVPVLGYEKEEIGVRVALLRLLDTIASKRISHDTRLSIETAVKPYAQYKNSEIAAAAHTVLTRLAPLKAKKDEPFYENMYYY